MRLFQSCAAVITAAALMCCACSLTVSAEGTALGDADTNGSLAIADAILINRIAAEDTVTVTDAGMVNADTDKDGVISVNDSTLLLQYLAGLISAGVFYGQINAEGYDLSGFAWQWPEVFAKDDTVTVTENSYKSHDVSITVTEHIEENMAYFVADIYVRDLSSFRSAFAGGTYPEPRSGQTDSISNMAAENNAILAINADYCEIRTTGVLYRNGVLYRDEDKDDVAVLTYDGILKTYSKTDFRLLTEEQCAQIWQSASFGPSLVQNGEPVLGYSGSIAVANPRSGVGYYEPGHYCFVQCDGRQDGYSIGMTMDEFALLFDSLGCTEAYNLDGGTSSEMVFMGERVNQPYNGGRHSSDIFYICEIPETTE